MFDDIIKENNNSIDYSHFTKQKRLNNTIEILTGKIKINEKTYFKSLKKNDFISDLKDMISYIKGGYIS